MVFWSIRRAGLGMRDIWVLRTILSKRTKAADLKMACRCAFPTATIRGYLLHFAHVPKHVQNIDLYVACTQDAKITLHICMCVELAIVPTTDVITAFEELKEYIDSFLDPLLEYLKDKFIGRRQRCRRKQPRLAIDW